MAVVGMPVGNDVKVTPEVLDRFYSQNEMHGLAEQFQAVAKAGLEESVDVFNEPNKFFMTPALKSQMKSFFVNESYDPNPDNPDMNPRAIKEHMDGMGALFEHDLQGIMEAAPLGAFNPVVGLTFPMHKNLLMTTVSSRMRSRMLSRALFRAKTSSSLCRKIRIQM